MARVFHITTASSSIEVDKNGVAVATFTVSNAAGRPLQARAVPAAQGDTGSEWLSIEGAAERPLAADGSDQFRVRIEVPAGTPAGSYPFRLDVISEENPDDDFAEGPVVEIGVKARAKEKKPFPWWILAAAAGVLVVGGLIAFLLRERKPDVPQVEVPELEGREIAEARGIIEGRGLALGEETERLTQGAQPGTVVEQSLTPGEMVDQARPIDLVVAAAGATVPDVLGLSQAEARRKLAAARLELGGPVLLEARNQAENDVVRKQDPDPGTLAPIGSAVNVEVSLFVIRGAEVPNVTGKAEREARALIEERGLRVGKVDRQPSVGGKAGTVVRQAPKAQRGEVVAQGSSVHLVVLVQGVQAPAVTGLPLPQAVSLLQRAGLRPEVVKTRPRPLPGFPQIVTSQTPPPGTVVPAGSSVRIVTYRD